MPTIHSKCDPLSREANKSSNLEGDLPSLLDALIPIFFLASLLAMMVYSYGDDASSGPNQIALTICCLIAAAIGLKNHVPWSAMVNGITRSIKQAIEAVFVLLAVGALIGSWAMSGTIASIVVYGLEFLNPAWFYPSVVILCGLTSASIGSSWSTMGTIGVGLMGIAYGMGASLEITAGAIICGSYFGDKLSPLSDTTNLAPGVSGVNLFTHIRHMLWTTVPSILITLLIFTAISYFTATTGDISFRNNSIQVISANYHIAWYQLFPLFIVLVMAVKKIPAFLTIMTGALVGGVFAAIFQPEQITQFVNRADLNPIIIPFIGVLQSMADGYVANTSNAELNDLLSRGGVKSMLTVIWLILIALTFGGIMEGAGLLQKLVEAILRTVRGTSSLITSTIITCIGTNVIASDQYMAIVLPGHMFQLEYKKRGIEAKNLSRALEDSGTLTSPLIPWNTCGAYVSGTLGIATLAYLPYCFFNLINPIISIIYGITGFTITKIKPTEKIIENNKYEE